MELFPGLFQGFPSCLWFSELFVDYCEIVLRLISRISDLAWPVVLICGFWSVVLICGFWSVVLICGFWPVALICGFWLVVTICDF